MDWSSWSLSSGRGLSTALIGGAEEAAKLAEEAGGVESVGGAEIVAAAVAGADVVDEVVGDVSASLG